MGTNILNFILKKLELFPQTLFVNRYHSDIFVGIIDITWQDPAVVREKISAYQTASSTIGISAFPWTISDQGILLLNSLKDILLMKSRSTNISSRRAFRILYYGYLTR